MDRIDPRRMTTTTTTFRTRRSSLAATSLSIQLESRLPTCTLPPGLATKFGGQAIVDVRNNACPHSVKIFAPTNTPALAEKRPAKASVTAPSPAEPAKTSPSTFDLAHATSVDGASTAREDCVEKYVAQTTPAAAAHQIGPPAGYTDWHEYVTLACRRVLC